MKRIIFVAMVLGLAVLAVPSAMAQLAIPSSSLAYGRTYSEWSAAWQQWALSIPVVNHPLFDNGDCSVGQSGPVWFLGGKFCALNNPNCGTTHVVRSCSVPAGKALYIPVLNAEWSVLEMNDPKFQLADLRSLAASNIEGATNLSFDIDGAKIPRLKKDFRIQSPAFVFTLPDDNLFNAVGGGRRRTVSGRSVLSGGGRRSVCNALAPACGPAPDPLPRVHAGVQLHAGHYLQPLGGEIKHAQHGGRRHS